MRGNTGSMILNMMTKFFPAHLVKALFFKNSSCWSFFQSAGRLQAVWLNKWLAWGDISWLCSLPKGICCMWFPNLSVRNPQRPWWVILTWRPWIYAEHTHNKKCRDQDGNQKLTERSERSTSGIQIWEMNTRYWLNASKCDYHQVYHYLFDIIIILSAATAKAA